MKKLILSLVLFLFLVIIVKAQWAVESTGFASASRGIGHIFAVDVSTVWATAYDGTGQSSMIIPDYTRTTDGGATWTAGSVTAASGLVPSMICAVNGNAAWIPFFDTINGGGKLFNTTDGGNTWVQQATTAFSAPSGFPDIVYFWDTNNGVTVGDPNGGYFEIYTTSDGGNTWTRVTQSNIPANLASEYGYIDVYSVFGDIIWFGTSKGRIYRSEDHGYNWTVITTPLSDLAKVIFVNEFKGFILNRNATTGLFQNLKYTEDAGLNWFPVNYSGTGGALYSLDMCYVPGTTNTFVSTGANYQDTTDLGSSFSFNFCSAWTDFVANDTLQYLAVTFVNNQTGWAGQFNTDASTGGMMKYVGSALSNYNNPTGGDGTVLCYRNSSYIFQPGDFIFSDQDNHTFGGITIMSLPANGSLKYAGTDVGLYSQCPDVTQLVFTPVTEAYGSPYATFTFKVKDSSGAYSTLNYTLTVNVSQQYSIDPINRDENLVVMPNPFHTVVTVRLPDGNHSTSLTLYDITGKILNSFIDPTNELILNRENLSNGVYYLKVTGDRTFVSKLMVY